MNNNQRLERISGIAAALFGLLALAYVLFGPVYQWTSSSGQNGTANMLQVGIQPTALVAFGILLLALIGVAVSTVLHSHTAENKWRIVLGAATIIIIIFTILTLPSIGLFILPSALLSLVTFVLSFPLRRAAQA
jgi:hypothetical protein